MRSVQKLAALFFLLFIAGCVMPSRVSVTDSGSGLRARPRPVDCRLEFFRTKVPERPYDEIGSLHWDGGTDAAYAEEELRGAACKLGADAVVVTRDYVPAGGDRPAYMSATAVRYRAAAAADAKAPAATAP